MRRLFLHPITFLVVLGLVSLSSAVVLASDGAITSPLAAQGDELPEADGEAVMDYILNQNDYTQWGSFAADRWTDFDGYLQSSAPHGQTVRIFVNDIARDAVAAEDFDGLLPPGSLVVKENFGGTVEEPGDLMAITLMYKVEGFNPDANDWYWIQAAPDGAVNAAGAVEGCIGCHSQEGQADYLLRYAFGEEPATYYGEPLPPADAQAVIDYISATSNYTEWGTWPTDDVNTEDYTGFLPSSAPHGNAVRIFVNDRALNALESEHFHGDLPNGSIVVKENYAGTVEEPGDLAAVTLMYKVDGFNPDAGDWFWLKTPGDLSSVDAAGAVEGCIGCHSQEGNSDYLLRFDLSPYAQEMMDDAAGDDMADDSMAETEDDMSSDDSMAETEEGS